MSQHLSAIDWHTSDAATVLAAHKSDATSGLAGAEADRRLHAQGPNELATPEAHSGLKLLLDQFQDFMTVVLLMAATVSEVLGEWKDALVIMAIVAINAVIGFTQARRADQAIAVLRRLAASRTLVLRDGQHQSIAASTLVPGDIVLLEAGNQVPADLRLLEVAQLKVDESALTGESVTAEKNTATLSGSNLALGDRLNMAFKGTTITNGRARGLVVATGMGTELGKVANLMSDALDRRTPLQQRLAKFSNQLSFVILAICAAMFGMGLLRGENPLRMLMTAISLAVAAIPEALPAVVTVLLAIGARRMANFKALIRRLPAVETLGSVSTICSDKTGTLTQNRMHAELAWAYGKSWHPTEAQAERSAPSPAHLQLLRAAALCNDAAPSQVADTDATLTWQGDPTETALAALAAQADLIKPALEEDTPRVHELPFDSDRKCMTTFHYDGTMFEAFTKGAPESVLPRCTATWSPAGPQPLDARAILAEADRLAAQGLRVLAFASRMWPQLPDTSDNAESIEKDLSFIGLIGLIDPPREEAAAAVRECIEAGIRPVMITGDHPATALAIARRLGIATDGATTVLTGTVLSETNDAELKAHVLDVRVYARVDPAQKIRIVQALQSHGQFVAMTGDGVNDAPALKQADIGVAMGKGGTDVAREASSLVLLDDNFATIVAAVREGRRIYDNIRKFVRYAMTGNSAEIMTLAFAPLLGLPIPLLPIHILWVNLVTDGLPGLALAAEPADRDIMRRAPRPPKESLFAHGMGVHIIWVGLLLTIFCLGLQYWAIKHADTHWQTMVFTTLTLGQMAHVMAIRSESDSLFVQGLLSNRPLLGAVGLTFALQMAVIYAPFLQPIFKTQPLSLEEMGLCIGLALLVGVAVEIEKAGTRRRRKR
jgi:Ca2+-transporting ATPase